MGKRTNPFTLEHILSRTVAAPPPAHCVDLGDCMLWTRAMDGGGRNPASVFFSGVGLVKPHRAVYLLVYGDVPEGCVVSRKCRRPACVAPAHIYARTGAETCRERDGDRFNLAWILANTVVQVPPDYCRDLGDCAMWQGAPLSDGYGRASFAGVRWRIHIAAYTVAHGPVPEGLWVCHLCDRPLCVAPRHLVARSAEWNNHDMLSKGRGAVPRGMEHVNSKLTEGDVRAIRTDTRSQYVVAADYGIQQTTVSAIKARKSWAWLED